MNTTFKTPFPLILRTFSLFCLLTFGCCKFATKEGIVIMLELSKAVIELITSFSENSDKLHQSVIKMTNATTQAVNEKQPVKDIALFWEENWDNIHEQFKPLEAQLKQIEVTTNQYFQKLDENNNKISDVNLKLADKEKTLQLKARWLVEYSKASNNINDVRLMLRKGNDYIQLLRNIALREEVEKSITDLNNISIQAENIASSIQDFKKNTLLIFQNQ